MREDILIPSFILQNVASKRITTGKVMYWDKTQGTVHSLALPGVVKEGQNSVYWVIAFFSKMRYVCNGVI